MSCTEGEPPQKYYSADRPDGATAAGSKQIPATGSERVTASAPGQITAFRAEQGPAFRAEQGPAAGPGQPAAAALPGMAVHGLHAGSLFAASLVCVKDF
jgi:hypothetical protein